MMDVISYVHKYARNAEMEGLLDEAAAGWLTLAVFKMASEKYQNTPTYRDGLTDCLRSEYCDVEAKNFDRARVTASFLRQHVDPLLQEDSQQIETGFGQEWCGDSYLLVQDSNAIECYKNARFSYQKIDLKTQLHWGARPEFDDTLLVMKRFCEQHELDVSGHSDIDFVDRIDWKLDICKEILGD